MIDGFAGDRVNFTKRTFEIRSDIIMDPRALQHTPCRVFLRSIFESLSFAASNITFNIHEFVFNPLSPEVVDEWDQIFLRTIRKHMQNAEIDLNEAQSSADIALRFIATAPGEIVCQHASHFLTKAPGQNSQALTFETADVFKQSLFPYNLLKFKFDGILSALLCLADQLAKYPLYVTASDEVEERLKFNYDRSFAQFAATFPLGAPIAHISLSRHVSREEQMRAPVLFFEGIHLDCYGHALLDNIFSLYLHLSAHGLLECPIVVIFADRAPVTDEAKLAVAQLLHAVSGTAYQGWLAHPRPADAQPPALRYTLASAADPVVGAVLRDMANDTLPYVADQRYASARRSPLLRGFIDRILGRMGLTRIAAEPRLVTLALRLENRRILNHRELAEFLAGRGYAVEEGVMTRLTLREQALQARRSAVLLGPYGSNLANAVFMRPGTAVVVRALARARARFPIVLGNF
jgi:hypothetical protein